MTVQGRPIAALERRIAALEAKRRERVQAEVEVLWSAWVAHDFGLTVDDLVAHQRVLGAHAAAELGVEAEDLIELLRVLGIAPRAGTAGEVQSAAERLNEAVRRAAREIFTWRSGRAYLRPDGEPGEPAPFGAAGWAPWEVAHPDLAAEFLRLRAGLRRLES